MQGSQQTKGQWPVQEREVKQGPKNCQRSVDRRAERMQKAGFLVPLLVLGWTGNLQGVPLISDPIFPVQENFDLTRFLGTWHDIAVATTCPHMRRNSGNAAIGKLVLQKGTNDDKLKMTKTYFRNGTCMEKTGHYEVTTTPGRFLYHIEKWNADVDAYVVHTNYNEYAVVLMSKEKSGGQKSKAAKLLSRTKSVRDTILDDFKTLVKGVGMSEHTFITKKDKGDCVPGQQLPTEPPTLAQRLRRDVADDFLLSSLDIEGSGDDTPLFNGTESCHAAPDAGPCLGMHQRYYYNSSSMSCELFKFGGCLGNQNNFESERECLQRCRTEAVCRLPMAAQPCTAQLAIWAFDSAAGLCVPYKQGFCQANANKFYSKAECEEYCGVIKDEELLKAN